MDILEPILDAYIPNPPHYITNFLQFPTPNIAHDSPDISLDATATSGFEGHDASAIIVMITLLTVPPIKFVQVMQQLIPEGDDDDFLPKFCF
jgi:hypothetical protein